MHETPFALDRGSDFQESYFCAGKESFVPNEIEVGADHDLIFLVSGTNI